MSKMVKGFGYALKGLQSVASSEQNFKIHIGAAIIVVLLAFYLDVSRMEWIALVVCIAGVMGAETMNTAIEKLCDVVSPQYDEKIKIVKDLAAAAVLILSIGALITGGIIFIPRILNQFAAL